jgi:acyl-CoA thioesterase-1
MRFPIRLLAPKVSFVVLLAVCAVLCGCRRSAPSLPTEDSPIIIALGDSITAGKTLDKALHYPDLIQAKFVADNKNVRFFNAGFAGDVCARAEQRARELLSYNPTMLIIALGTNDITGKTTPEQAGEQLAAAIEAMQQENVSVLLIGSQVRRVSSERLAAYAEMYRDLASRYDVPLILDILASVSDQPGLILADNIHPTASGQRAIAEVLYQPITRALEDVLASRRKNSATDQN